MRSRPTRAQLCNSGTATGTVAVPVLHYVPVHGTKFSEAGPRRADSRPAPVPVGSDGLAGHLAPAHDGRVHVRSWPFEESSCILVSA